MQLKDICTIKSSKRIFESEYVCNWVPFIRWQEVSNWTLLTNDIFECYISWERYDEIKNKYWVPKKWDILITAVWTIGNLCYIDRDFDFYYKDWNLIQFTNFNDGINPKYLYYFMKSSLFKRQIEYNLIWAVQKALTMDMLGKIEVELPEIEIQNKIADILSKIDNQIERNNRMIQSLQVLGKSVYCKNKNDNTFCLLKDISEISTWREDANHATANWKFKFFTCSEEALLCDDYKFDWKYILVAWNGNFNVKFYDWKFNAYQRTYTIKNDTIFGDLYYTLFYKSINLY